MSKVAEKKQTHKNTCGLGCVSGRAVLLQKCLLLLQLTTEALESLAAAALLELSGGLLRAGRCQARGELTNNAFDMLVLSAVLT